MRVIPKNTKVRSTVWMCYAMPDIILALVLFAVIVVCFTLSQTALAVFFCVVTVLLLMPTSDGIMYMIIRDFLKYVFSRKSYSLDTDGTGERSVFAVEEISEDGLVSYSDGYFARVISVGQKNFAMEDLSSQDGDIEYFASALKLIEENQFADIVKIERPINLDAQSSRLFSTYSKIAAEAGDSSADGVRRRILSERIDGIDTLNNVSRKFVPAYYIVIYGRNAQDTDNTAISVSAEISKTGVGSSLCGRRDAALYLKYGVSRLFDEREISSVQDDRLPRWTMPGEVRFSGSSYSADGLPASVMAVTDYPLNVRNAWGSELFNMEGTKIVMRVRPVPKDRAIKRIDKCISDMQTRAITTSKASEASGADTHRETMEGLLARLQRDNETLLDTSVFVTVYDYDGTGQAKREIRKRLTAQNFRVSTLYGLQRDAYRAVSGASPSFSRFDRGINSSSLAAVFPFVRTYLTDMSGVYLGNTRSSAYPFILDIWKRGNLYQNSNAMVIGKSGSGKSFFMKTLIANEWSDGVRIMILDPESEYTRLTKNLGGGVTDAGRAEEGRINPFHIYRILTEDGRPCPPSVTFNTHLKVLESFFRIVLEGAGSDIIELINSLSVETYSRRGIDESTDTTAFAPDMFPTFTDLLETVHLRQAVAEAKGDALMQRDLRRAELYLDKFVSGRYSDIWNGPSTMECGQDITDFDFQSLFASRNNVVANAQMLLIFRFIEQEIINAREMSQGEGTRTMIVVDEAHLFIDARYPAALDFFYSMCKRIRKYGGAFIPATQNIADWNASEELRAKTSAIIKNSQYMFIFKLTAPDMKDLSDLYSAGDGFNDEEKRRIISSGTGQAFFVGSTEFRTTVSVKAGDYVRSLFEDAVESKPGAGA